MLATDVSPAALDETRSIIDGEGSVCATVRADVSAAPDVETMVQRRLEAFGRVDILCVVDQGPLGGPSDVD